MSSLNARTALVTGGASGLGKAIAQRLVADGVQVVIGDLQAGLGQAVAAEGGFTFVEQDVRDEGRWREIIEGIEKQFGRLDILVNNAGVLEPMQSASPESTALAEWQRTFAVNVEGVFLGCRAGITSMRRSGGGSIVNISSLAALMATPFATAYGASKAAVRQLTKSVAQHCAQQKLNIRCNSVHPGMVHTALWEKGAIEEAQLRGLTLDAMIAEARSMVPMGDLTRPEDVAAAVSFLVSPDARHMTGTQLVVDGGLLNCDTY